MSGSIIQKEKECYLCRMEAGGNRYCGELPGSGLERHHFMHGTAGRKKAEHYGLWGYLCTARHHIYGPDAVHANTEVDRMLQQTAQRVFEEKYGHAMWMEEFGKNYLDGAQEGRGKDNDTGGFIRLQDSLGGLPDSLH